MDLTKAILVFSVLLATGKALPHTQGTSLKNVSSTTPTPPSTSSTKPSTIPNVTERAPSSSTQVVPQGDRFNEFDWMLCKKIVETAKGNIIVSPISLKLVLAMVYEGASGQTAEEIAAALDLSRENFGRQISRKKFSQIVGNLKSSKGEYDLNLGTSMFIDKSVTPKPSYVRKLQSFYEAQIEQVDFSMTLEAIAAINAWASGVTKGNIHSILSRDDASANTVLMLLNAIYFKGNWLYKFPENKTKSGTFYANGVTPVQAKFMNCAYNLYYLDAHEINSQIVKLPYVGTKFAMYIILPYNRTGLHDLVNYINPFILKEHSKSMYETTVELSMPKFKIDFTANLGEPLKKLGIQRLFGGAAELNEIAEVANNSITVSNILQKAGIEVNEEGSTAYAATEAEIVNKFGDSTNVKLTLEHPFLFFIKDEETDSVLFVGNLMNPNTDDISTFGEIVTPPTAPVNIPVTPPPTALPTIATTPKPVPKNTTTNGSTTESLDTLIELVWPATP